MFERPLIQHAAAVNYRPSGNPSYLTFQEVHVQPQRLVGPLLVLKGYRLIQFPPRPPHDSVLEPMNEHSRRHEHEALEQRLDCLQKVALKEWK